MNIKAKEKLYYSLLSLLFTISPAVPEWLFALLRSRVFLRDHEITPRAKGHR